MFCPLDGRSKGSKEIEWHCKHYISRGVMKRFGTGTDLAREMGVNPSVLTATFHKYNTIANGQAKCPYGKKFFQNAPFDLSDEFCVAYVLDSPPACVLFDNMHTSVLGPNLLMCCGHQNFLDSDED